MVLSPKKKILLAEDDDSMRRFIEIVLRRENYEVLTAEDGLAAMQIALENHIDAVVADAVMPNFTGFDLCRMLRDHADKKHVPLVILSGLAERSPDNSVADVFLVKDTNLKEELLSVLKNLL